MARPYFCNCVVFGRIVRIDRGRKANVIGGRVADGLILESREITEHLNEIETNIFRLNKQRVEVPIQLRFTADELYFATAKPMSLKHQGLIVILGQNIAMSAMGI